MSSEILFITVSTLESKTKKVCEDREKIVCLALDKIEAVQLLARIVLWVSGNSYELGVALLLSVNLI